MIGGDSHVSILEGHRDICLCDLILCLVLEHKYIVDALARSVCWMTEVRVCA